MIARFRKTKLHGYFRKSFREHIPYDHTWYPYSDTNHLDLVMTTDPIYEYILITGLPKVGRMYLTLHLGLAKECGKEYSVHVVQVTLSKCERE